MHRTNIGYVPQDDIIHRELTVAEVLFFAAKLRYKIISLLGQGSFGETYLAEDLGVPINPKPKRVVKRLKTQNFIDAQLDWVKNAFEQEAATLYKLSQLHPQIPNLLEYFQVEEEFYFVQDFINGVDLTSF